MHKKGTRGDRRGLVDFGCFRTAFKVEVDRLEVDRLEVVVAFRGTDFKREKFKPNDYTRSKM